MKDKPLKLEDAVMKARNPTADNILNSLVEENSRLQIKVELQRQALLNRKEEVKALTRACQAYKNTTKEHATQLGSQASAPTDIGNPATLVKEWHNTFKPTVNHHTLILEEWDEWLAESAQFTTGDVSSAKEELKELCDLLFVIYGYAYQRQWNIDMAFWKVFVSNMSKEKTMDSAGKIIKGASYVPPDLSGCV